MGEAKRRKKSEETVVEAVIEGLRVGTDPNTGQVVGAMAWIKTAADEIYVVVAEAVRTLILPPEARRVRIFADNDERGQGVAAAREARRRWVAEGREVAVSIAPTVGDDANDIILKRLKVHG